MRNLKGNRLTHKDKISYLKHHLTTILPIHHLTSFVYTIKPIIITPSYLSYHLTTLHHFSTIITITPYTHNGYQYHQSYNTILYLKHHLTITPYHHLTTLHTIVSPLYYYTIHQWVPISPIQYFFNMLTCITINLNTFTLRSTLNTINVLSSHHVYQRHTVSYLKHLVTIVPPYAIVPTIAHINTIPPLY